MKKVNKMFILCFVFVLGLIFVQSECYADDLTKYGDRTQYIDESFCYLDIDSDGEASIDAFCRAKVNKPIYGKIIIQRERWYGWSNVKTIYVTGYNGRLDTNRCYSLSKKGTYRVKFKTTCCGETYSVYSTEEKY